MYIYKTSHGMFVIHGFVHLSLWCINISHVYNWYALFVLLTIFLQATPSIVSHHLPSRNSITHLRDSDS